MILSYVYPADAFIQSDFHSIQGVHYTWPWLYMLRDDICFQATRYHFKCVRNTENVWI